MEKLNWSQIIVLSALLGVLPACKPGLKADYMKEQLTIGKLDNPNRPSTPDQPDVGSDDEIIIPDSEDSANTPDVPQDSEQITELEPMPAPSPQRDPIPMPESLPEQDEPTPASNNNSGSGTTTTPEPAPTNPSPAPAPAPAAETQTQPQAQQAQKEEEEDKQQNENADSDQQAKDEEATTEQQQAADSSGEPDQTLETVAAVADPNAPYMKEYKNEISMVTKDGTEIGFKFLDQEVEIKDGQAIATNVIQIGERKYRYHTRHTPNTPEMLRSLRFKSGVSIYVRAVCSGHNCDSYMSVLNITIRDTENREQILLDQLVSTLVSPAFGSSPHVHRSVPRSSGTLGAELNSLIELEKRMESPEND